MNSSRKAFTMIELIFVIVVIGILSAIAIPKFAATRDDAVITRARETIASVRSALTTEHQKMVLRGVFADINATTVGSDFSGLLQYTPKQCPTSKCGGWSFNTGTKKYTFHGPTGDVVFKLESNRFKCDSGPCSLYE